MRSGNEVKFRLIFLSAVLNVCILGQWNCFKMGWVVFFNLRTHLLLLSSYTDFVFGPWAGTLFKSMINIIKRLQIINMISLCCFSCPTRSLQDEVSAYNYLIKLVKNAWPVCLLPPLSLFIYTSFAFPSFPPFSPSFLRRDICTPE